MKRRFDYLKHAPGRYKAVTALERYLQGCGLAWGCGCVYCIDTPWRELRFHRFLTSF